MPVSQINSSDLLAQRKRNVYVQVQKSKGTSYSQIENKSFGYDTVSLIKAQRGLDEYLTTTQLSVSISGTFIFQGSYNINTLDLNALKIAFARQFGVNVSQVTIVVSPGSVVIEYTIVTTPTQSAIINNQLAPGTSLTNFSSSLLSSINSSNIVGLTLTPNSSVFLSTRQLVTTLANGFTNPSGICLDGLGNLYISDSTDNKISKLVISTGVVTTLVSSGLNSPSGICSDSSGNLFVGDPDNNRIAKINVGTGAITTLTSVFNGTSYVCHDNSTYIYAIDGARIAKIDKNTGVATTLANGFSNAFGLCTDYSGHVYVADSVSNMIYIIDLTTGTSTPIANGFSNAYGDMCYNSGYLYMSVPNSNHIMKIDVSTGTHTTLTSNMLSGFRDGNYSNAQFSNPIMMCTEGHHLYVCDNGNCAIRDVVITN